VLTDAFGEGLHLVEVIDQEVADGGPLCKHRGERAWGAWFLCDGTILHKEDGTFVSPTNSSGNQHHIGCPDRAATKQVEGGTFLIEGTADLYTRRVTRVHITPAANRGMVAKFAATRNDYRLVCELQKQLG
jgi:hypothetical protein